MASLGLLAAGVAHEVNTPLTGISSFTQMLQDQTGKDDPKSKLLEKIERQTERASKIVNNLLNFARQGRSGFVAVQLNDVIRDVLSLLEHQLTRSHIKVRLELAEVLPRVMGDENKLQQVFLNLILNAQDAMPSGGWLTMTTAMRGGEVVATVADTGHGIGLEDVKRIYDPFFTTKRAGSSGTGLGFRSRTGSFRSIPVTSMSRARLARARASWYVSRRLLTPRTKTAPYSGPSKLSDAALRRPRAA